MILQSRAGLYVELPDDEFVSKEKTLSLAGRIYKSRKFIQLLSSRDALLRLMEHVNQVRHELGLPERGLLIADDPMRSLDDVSESDLEWNAMIAKWRPSWKISAPDTWGIIHK